MTTTTASEAIPTPRGLPVLGNLLDARGGNIENLMRLARKYGPIFRLELPGTDRVLVSSLDLVDEVCDETRFDKLVAGGLSVLRGSKSGSLFTAETDDPMWHRAHNILMPPFSLQSMRDYMPMMLDVADQLVAKWERLNADDDVDVPADMTRLTLDTIALCGFGYRFNSFYRDTPHPFVQAMVRTLTTAQAQGALPSPVRGLQKRKLRQFERDDAYMNATVDMLIRERRESGDTTTRDLLGCMLTGVDKQSGERLPDDNIRAQCITFLIAGHETTSGLLSFAIYYLLQNPGVAERARDEVDRVLGADVDAPPTYEQVHKLTYVTQVLDEVLRLWPTAPAFSRRATEDTTIGGRYPIPKDTGIVVLTPMLHRDQRVWGPDAETYNPDRFAAEKRAALPPNAFRPFGSGQRACIGRQFAMQEAVLVLGMLLQRFELIDAYDYRLSIKQTLTLKPENFRIKVKPRPGRTRGGGARRVEPVVEPQSVPAPADATPAADGHGTPLTVLFGSNLGTAEGIATKLAQEGAERGFAVTTGALDEHVGALPTEGAVIVVAASYNGAPPDNAERFCAWLRDPATGPDACAGVRFTVFGCGNTEWAATYQSVPKLIDAELEAHGATRIHDRGEGDARGDFDGQYRDWHADLWPGVASALSLAEPIADVPDRAGFRLAISMVNMREANPVVMSYAAQQGMVAVNRELQRKSGPRPAERSTRHVEIALPAGATYGAGDHLGVLPRNRPELIGRVLRRFKLDAGTYITVTARDGASAHTHLPIDKPVPLVGILSSCVELQDVATRRDLEVMAAHTEDAAQREKLLALADDGEEGRAAYREEVLLPRKSILDLLEEYRDCALAFDAYLDLLPALRPRYYSISSSPLVSPEVCSITAGVLETPAATGHGVFRGVCSNHLAASEADSTVFVFVRAPTIPFRPPENPHVPMIMIGCGTGLAPFRGFLQERAAQKERGVPVAGSLLFFGCRDPQQDLLYEDELRGFEEAGLVRLCTAFSRVPDQRKTYVQEVIEQEREDVWRLLQQEAVIFVCGDASKMAPDVRRAFLEVFREKTGASAADAEAWLAGLRSADRYLEDIWGGGQAVAGQVAVTA
jgi:cytochrome P450 / NADPH-cytochrome P450 reductase